MLILIGSELGLQSVLMDRAIEHVLPLSAGSKGCNFDPRYEYGFMHARCYIPPVSVKALILVTTSR